MRVAVIGAGIVGGAIAFHLSRRGAKVTLIDAGEPGMGASSHSFAWINAFGKEPRHYNELNRRSLDTWDRFSRLLGGDIGLLWGGQLTWVATEDDARRLRGDVAKLQSWGYVARLIGESEMRSLEPGLSPGPVAAAAISDNDGHVLATRAAQACARRVLEMGGDVLPGSPVTGLRTRGQRVVSVEVGDVLVDCDAAVVAAGVATTEVAGMAGVRVPQVESPGVVARTNPLPPALTSVAALYAPPVGDGRSEVHVRQSVDGVVMIGEGTQESLSRDDSQEHAEELVARAACYLPILEGSKAVPVPVGYRPMPADGRPITGFASAVPNLYIALMHSGVTLAPLIGELATMEILDGACVDTLDPYRLQRFD